MAAPPSMNAAEATAAPVRQRFAEMLALEETLEKRLDGWRAALAGHPAAAAAVERFHDLAKAQRDAMRDHQLTIGGSGDLQQPPARRERGVEGREEGASAALREAYTLFNEAAIGYAALHLTAHVFHTGQLATTLTLVAQHLRGYAAAAQEVHQLIADVVAWELRQQGQRCLCPCARCGIGVCWCISDTTSKLAAAWRETAPPALGGVRVAPTSRATPSLDVREGDVVVAINGTPVGSADDVRAALPPPAPGEPVRLDIRRADGQTVEVVAARP